MKNDEDDSDSVYQLKVSLKDSHPTIWRRILIPATASFWELHIAIQDSFGWEDCHLHEFYIGHAWDSSVPRIRLPYPPDEYDLDGQNKSNNEEFTCLNKYLNPKNLKATYVYDFGDSWEHQLVLEKILTGKSDEAYPRVIDGRRAGPWEDSGSIWGYEEKLGILNDKKHLDHNDLLEWVGLESGELYDPDYFDSNDVIFRNAATELARLKKTVTDG